MSGDVQLELWLHEYKMEALSAVLEEQGTSVEKEMQERLIELYAELVPCEIQQEIRARIDAEYAARKAEQELAEEAARRYTGFRVRKNGTENFFRLDRGESFLGLSKFLRGCLKEGRDLSTAALQSHYAGLTPITAEEYGQMLEQCMEQRSKITGVFDLDFEKGAVSAASAADGWRTCTVQDAASAAYYAYRKQYLSPEQYERRFQDRLSGKLIASAGHLSAQEISFAEEICEAEGLLNFYMETNFDVDTVFGTHVCIGESDDTLNVYANYDCAAGQVCDTLDVNLRWADGHEEALTYRLNAAEKEVLLRKMDEYCLQQTGQPLAEYSGQLMAEEMGFQPPQAPQM